MTQAELIAAGLSEAQRRELKRRDTQAMDDLPSSNVRMANALHRMGLTYVCLSPLGEQVRAILLKGTE
ncbi:hypothetical protein [Sphingobium sp. WCS2017Hpa-17]|uniref:hypothetical protein n=1 Tax=Sphingobium sp. WCS2017Hpa-17 TaxID=3073638 RepID=UPI002889F5A5|nr:hypothetical protein [Sphingobium sp. WCS2017Hpa-17]